MLGGGGGGAGLGLDLSAVLQAAVVGLVLLSAAVAAVRRAASRYFVVDAAGFAASYEDHHRQPAYPPPPSQGKQLMAQEQSASIAGGERAACAECGCITTKKCTGCMRVRYCSQECQSKHWRSDHKFKCKQMKLLDPADKMSCGGEASNKKSSGFGPISLVPAHRKLNKVLFPYDDFLKLYNWKDLDFLPCGLMNCGNSCFANVVLQCLSCTGPLVAYLLGKDHSRQCTRRHEDWCFLCELQCHIQRASESLHPFAPMNILSHLPNIGGNLGFGRQEDAHEFMRFAIDKMQSACLDEFGGEKAVDLSTQETTLIQHIFGGRLQSQVQCTACGMVSNRYDNMMDLTVEIQGDAASLEECLDQFTAVEWLDGDNKYKCDGCSDYVKAWKRLTVHQAPNILTITLKRFQSGRFGKLNKRIAFPLKLDLLPYMSSSDGSDLYELYAVVVHLDMLNASFFGHYICYTKDYHGRWYKIDDCKVEMVDEEEVLAQGAYMLLYSRRTARPRPLIAAEEPLKKQQQCKVLPLNGPNHLNRTEDVSLSCELSPKSFEVSLPDDSESNNESSPMMDAMDQEADLNVHIDINRGKLALNGNLQGPDVASLPSSSTSHVPEEVNCIPCSTLEGSTMTYEQFCSSLSEASSVHSSAEQQEEPAACSDSVDYMEIDTDASTEVERWKEPASVLDDSSGRRGNRTSVPNLENGLAGKPKALFSRGFLNKPSRKKSSFGEEYQIGNERVATSQKLNGYCNGPLSNSGQEDYANSFRGNRFSGNAACNGHLKNSGQEDDASSFWGNRFSGKAACNGGMFLAANNANNSFVNGNRSLSNDSSHAENRDVPFVSHGFIPRPYRESSDIDTNWNKTNDVKTLVDGNNKSISNLPVEDCQGGMSFLHHGFPERPCTREQSVQNDDCSSSNNGASSFVNGNIKSSNNASARDGKGGIPLFSPGFLTRCCTEPLVMGTSTTYMHDLKTYSNISTEQASLIAAECSDQIQERWSSDCTANGSVFQHREAFNNIVSSHHDENGHALLGTENTTGCGEANDSDGTDVSGNGYQKDDGPAMLVSEKSLGSGNVDHLNFMSGNNGLEHDGLRRRLTPKFPEQNGIDAK